MLTAKNPECSRCCRFVGTQFESGRDYGVHGNAYILTGMGSGECALPRIWWFESSCKHRGARYGEHGNVYIPELVERIRYSTGLIYFNAEVQILL